MKSLAILLASLVVLSAPAFADEDADRIRALEERVRQLEARLSDQSPGFDDDIDAELESYLGDGGVLGDPQAVMLSPDGGPLAGLLDFSISGQLWLFHNIPSSGLGYDAGRERTDMDYLYLFLGRDPAPLGYRFWVGFRDSNRYTDASPYGTQWIHEAAVTAAISTVDLGEGAPHVVNLEVGKVFVPFGVVWDHTWYGSILYYKGMMLDSDWGAKAFGSLALSPDATLDWAAGYFNRSDELDGASTFAGYGLEGSPFQSPEFTDDPAVADREQRGQFAARLAATATLGEGVNATIGGSYLTGRIRESAPDGSARFHYGARTGSHTQRDYEADLHVGIDGIDLGFIVIPRAELLLEHVWYDRGPKSQSGKAWLAELYFKLWEDAEAEWIRTIEVWYNLSVDHANSQPDSVLHLPTLGFQLSDQVRLLLEYVSFKTSDYTIDRGIFIHVSFDF